MMYQLKFHYTFYLYTYKHTYIHSYIRKSTWVIIERLENFYICMYVIRCQQTEIARRIAKLSQAPFIKVEATKFTEVIYVYKCMWMY